MIEKIRDIKEMKEVVLDDTRSVSLAEFIAVVRYHAKVSFSSDYEQRVNTSREIVEKFLLEGRIIYGVTTGFGENVRYTISPSDAERLQRNIIRSHACAVGKPFSEEQARAVMMVTLVQLGHGSSGIRLETLQLIRDVLNQNLYPFAPSEGSVGYLGVEGHFAMAYMGEGAFFVNDKKCDAESVLQAHGLKPMRPQCKEGLSLLNGTITVTALSLLALFDAEVSMRQMDLAGALCYEALRGTTKALDPRIHENKMHIEQRLSAENLRKILMGSQISETYRDAKVQDAYLLRAMPQIHSSAYRLVNEAEKAILDELHSVSDNPEIFLGKDGDGDALMCGNFDGSVIGSHADMLAIAAAISGGHLERCIDRMVNRNLNDGLPAFLAVNPGLNNGYMIPQYTAAGLVGELKMFAVPATVDSVSTCANQEDPVSMAYNAAVKSGKAVNKLQYIMAIQVMVCLQAIDLLNPLAQGPVTKMIHDYVRQTVPFAEEDRFFYTDIEFLYNVIKQGDLLALVEDVIEININYI